ncbi:DUF6153 family protein [Streptomyces sp. NPDC005708]|uniref:DUF6153 family protein n=1 Tax=Streptomyces sp. NPDC005708 TaxID=3154564 RepID=UPI0033D67391
MVLALGVFLMHTLGHPQDSASTAMSTASHSSVDTMGGGRLPHQSMAAAPADDASEAKTPGHTASTHKPPMAMDMMSLCVGVLLAAWALAALVRSAFARHPDWLASLLAQAPVVLRGIPPPRGPDLTQLSVLRL